MYIEASIFWPIVIIIAIAIAIVYKLLLDRITKLEKAYGKHLDYIENEKNNIYSILHDLQEHNKPKKK